MVMSLQNHVNIQILEYRDKFISPLQDIAFRRVARHTVQGMVKYNYLPVHILVFLNRIFHECLMLCGAHVVRIQVHEKDIVVNIPVIASCSCRAILALIRIIKRLYMPVTFITENQNVICFTILWSFAGRQGKSPVQMSEREGFD